MKQSRWRSPYVWTSLAAIAILLMNNYGLWNFIGMDENIFKDLLNLVLVFLASIGVVNNPTDAEEW